MNESARRRRNAELVKQLHPRIRPAVEWIIAEAFVLYGVRFRINHGSAFRTYDQQLASYARGTSWTKHSLHNTIMRTSMSHTFTPAALAVDLLDDNNPFRDHPKAHAARSILAYRIGMTTGALWGLATRMRKLRQEAIELHAFDDLTVLFKHQVGVDPRHVEPLNAREVIAHMRKIKTPRAITSGKFASERGYAVSGVTVTWPHAKAIDDGVFTT